MSLRTPVTLAQPAVLPGLARRRGLRLALGLGAAALGGGTAQPTVQAAVRRLHWDQRVLQGFGTRLWLQAGHHDPQALQRALDKTVLRLRDIESAMSLFQADSALNRLNRQGYLDRPPADLLAVLRLARQVSAASHGAFDVSMQPLWQVWSEAMQSGHRPAAADLARACRLVGWQALAIEEGRLRLQRAGMALSLNGIAQGYAADAARQCLQAHGVQHALLDCGEWSSLGSPPGDHGAAPEAVAPWRIALADPLAGQALLGTIALHGRSLAYSTDAQTRFSADGRDHHILDPRSGRSPAQASAVAVVAGSCALADALTKVFFMAAEGPGSFQGWVGRSAALCAHWQVQCVLVDKQGRRWASAGLGLSLAEARG